MTNSAWSVQEIEQLYDLPLHELILQAGQVHAKNFPDGDIELATLLSIKTGGCPGIAHTVLKPRATTLA